MKTLLILLAHPVLHKSKINKALIESVENTNGITINNLYDNYPDFYIDKKKEQQLLINHDIIVWHHPFYWYSAPALLKEWFDLVLQYGFAYGKNGNALKGKIALSAITTGGKKEVYTQSGSNHYTINEFLFPFRQSANLCQMNYISPFVVHGTHAVTDTELIQYSSKYKNTLLALRDEKIEFDELKKYNYLNDLIL